MHWNMNVIGGMDSIVIFTMIINRHLYIVNYKNKSKTKQNVDF